MDREFKVVALGEYVARNLVEVNTKTLAAGIANAEKAFNITLTSDERVSTEICIMLMIVSGADQIAAN